MDSKNSTGNTPLHVCAVNNQEACARMLLFRGANRGALNYANQTPYQVGNCCCLFIIIATIFIVIVCREKMSQILQLFIYFENFMAVFIRPFFRCNMKLFFVPGNI